ncbi:MAG TPA: CARDB domain-containing protein [Candidatus Nanoarchaeia archaeon]|nr:CARDB domain-containing protein [Candidatus Nanoarchaeia archaeon]
MGFKNNKEILVLTVLVVVTVMLNFSLILLIETSKSGDVSQRLLRTVTGNNQLDIFSDEALKVNVAKVTLTKKSSSRDTTKSGSGSPQATIAGTQGVKTVTKIWGKKSLMYKNEIPLTIDYDKGVIEVQGEEIPIIVDGGTWEDFKPSVTGTHSYIQLSYSRFEAYIDPAYYTGRETAIQDYLNKLHLRFIEMETQTGWSSEKFYGKKLDIYIYDSGSTCANGWAITGEAHIGLTTLFTNPNACKYPYYVNGIPLFNNLGAFDDHWIYGWDGLHESLHSINPLPLFSNKWLTEGLSEYYGFNILKDSSDINQETANYYIENANFTITFSGSFSQYVANDYKNVFGEIIQDSAGYDISAWMFSMMRDDHGLDWTKFYQLIEDNPETLDKSYQLGGSSWFSIYTDTHIIDLFGRASGLSFPQTKAIWQYDGPSGPGWGVRNWTDTNGVISWYADLVPSLSFYDSSLPGIYIGENVTITANVSNNGQVNLNNVSVKIYEGTNLLKEQIININAGNVVPISVVFTSATPTSYNIGVVVDGANIKVESNESNNENTSILTFKPAKCGDLDNSGAIDIIDVVNIVNVAFRGQAQGNNPVWVWDVDLSGAVDVIDVVKIVNVAFRGANEATEFNCDEPGEPSSTGSSSLVLTNKDARELTQILASYGVKNVNLYQYVPKPVVKPSKPKTSISTTGRALV